MSIQCILFDADGVVIHPWRFRRYLERRHRITPSMTQGFFTGVFNQCLVGRADLADVLPPHLRQWGWPGSVEDFIETWLEVENDPDERLLSAISELRGRGYFCGLATSQEANRARFITVEMAFDEIFDAHFFSCYIGWQKPQSQFYRSIQSKLGLDGERILFWDDSERNVAAARDVGWNAEVYRGFDDFRSRLSVLLGSSPAARNNSQP